MHQALGGGGWVLWVLFVVALWALVIMAVMWFTRELGARRRGPASATAILAERFAQGQIDETEYRTRLAVLRGERPTAVQGPPPSSPPPPPSES